jgi:hypothetical protein
MKQTPDMDRFQKNMAPGAITREGFLGTDSRTLADILTEDDARVNRLRLSHRGIGRRMRALREAGLRGLETAVVFEEHFEVRAESVRGKLPCPFLHGVFVPKINTHVLNRRTGESIVFTDLNLHMIEEHGFYEGRDALFRLDPERLKTVLEIPEEEGA